MDKYIIKVKDRIKLMMFILNYNNSIGYISLEGDFEDYNLGMLYCQVDEKDTLLIRNCISKADFFVFDLTKVTVDNILKIFNSNINIYHTKICDKNKLLFEAYDHFQHCYLDATFYNSTFINELISRDIIEIIELVRS